MWLLYKIKVLLGIAWHAMLEIKGKDLIRQCLNLDQILQSLWIALFTCVILYEGASFDDTYL